MKILFSVLSVIFILSSCGPSAEEREKQRIQDSIKAEEDRLRAIEEADAFITGIPEETDSLLLSEEQ